MLASRSARDFRRGTKRAWLPARRMRRGRIHGPSSRLRGCEPDLDCGAVSGARSCSDATNVRSARSERQRAKVSAVAQTRGSTGRHCRPQFCRRSGERCEPSECRSSRSRPGGERNLANPRLLKAALNHRAINYRLPVQLHLLRAQPVHHQRDRVWPGKGRLARDLRRQREHRGQPGLRRERDDATDGDRAELFDPIENLVAVAAGNGSDGLSSIIDSPSRMATRANGGSKWRRRKISGSAGLRLRPAIQGASGSGRSTPRPFPNPRLGRLRSLASWASAWCRGAARSAKCARPVCAARWRNGPRRVTARRLPAGDQVVAPLSSRPISDIGSPSRQLTCQAGSREVSSMRITRRIAPPASWPWRSPRPPSPPTSRPFWSRCRGSPFRSSST